MMARHLGGHYRELIAKCKGGNPQLEEKLVDGKSPTIIRVAAAVECGCGTIKIPTIQWFFINAVTTFAPF
jgi:hypothetical protein